MKIIVRESAYRDLDEIHRCINADRPSAADRVLQRILRSIELLGQFPYIGRKGLVSDTYE